MQRAKAKFQTVRSVLNYARFEVGFCLILHGPNDVHNLPGNLVQSPFCVQFAALQKDYNVRKF